MWLHCRKPLRVYFAQHNVVKVKHTRNLPVLLCWRCSCSTRCHWRSRRIRRLPWATAKHIFWNRIQNRIIISIRLQFPEICFVAFDCFVCNYNAKDNVGFVTLVKIIGVKTIFHRLQMHKGLSCHIWWWENQIQIYNLQIIEV